MYDNADGIIAAWVKALSPAVKFSEDWGRDAIDVSFHPRRSPQPESMERFPIQQLRDLPPRKVWAGLENIARAMVDIWQQDGVLPKNWERSCAAAAKHPNTPVILDTIVERREDFLDFSIEVVRVEAGPPIAVAEFTMRALVACGSQDWVDKENHGPGYHFHLCDSKKKRTDVVMVFDPKQATATNARRSLYWEYHAEKKAKAKAKPAAYKVKRKKTIHAVCTVEGEKVGFANFRPPSKDANVLWP